MKKGYAHVALYTDKFEDSIKFYCDCFEGKVLGCWGEAPKRGCWIDLQGSILEIFEGELAGKGMFGHIAIETDEVSKIYDSIESFGGSKLSEVKDIMLPIGNGLAATIAFVKGINGEEIELFDTKM